jgi:hypothetical protein
VSLEFDREQIFLPELLSLNGYQTAIFSNHWAFIGPSYLKQKFDQCFYLRVSGDRPTDGPIISSAISWIKKNKNKRFFLYYHILSPHVPYTPKEEDGEFIQDGNLHALEEIRKKIKDQDNELSEGWSEDDLTHLMALYDSNLKHSDKWVGVLYDALKEISLADQTLIIITSDHGENLGEHNNLYHGDFPPWDSLTHVPLIIRYPPKIPAGIKISGLTESIDIVPTILDICGLDPPRGKAFDGTSLLRFIDDPDKGKSEIISSDGIRSKTYMYSSKWGLFYDLKKDPDEKENIIDRVPELAEMMASKYNEIMGPCWSRFKRSRRKDTPDFPFYYRITDFKMVTAGNIRKIDTNKHYWFCDSKISYQDTWLVNTHYGQYGLTWFYKENLPLPITLSANLPNGTYRIYLLLEFAENIADIAGLISFRFNQGSPLTLPYEVENMDARYNEFYLNLGEITVSNNSFFVELTLNRLEETPFVIRHIEFVPEGCRKSERLEEFDRNQWENKKELFRSLGYL